MRDNVEGTLSILAALLVVFTNLLDPRISFCLAVTFLLVVGVYHFVQARLRVPPG